MSILPDTNLLPRAVLWVDTEPASVAQWLFLREMVTVVPVPVLCEFAWVSKRGWGTQDINDARGPERRAEKS